MLSAPMPSSPRISQESIQACNGDVSTPACPTPPRANFSFERWVSARVTAAWPIQSCWLAQPSSCAPGRIDWRNRVHWAPKAAPFESVRFAVTYHHSCLLYTSDAADDLLCVDLGGRR